MIRIIEAFEKENQDIEIEIVSSPNADYETKLTTMLSGGDDIDVFFAKSNTALPGLQAKGYCMNLSNLLEENKFDTSSYGTVLEQQMTFDDNVYALPFRTNDWVLFYNKNLFDKAGIAYPTDQMTWQDVGKLAKEVTEKSADGVYGYSFQPKVGFIFPMLAGTMDGFDITTSIFPVLQPRWIGFWICRKVEQWRNIPSRFP
ncbi:extracellular solute-binding protein [Blautia sp. RD014234]|nr:extracellular solute-binding protein [Blautia parvula]